jgi:hypothetical protein
VKAIVFNGADFLHSATVQAEAQTPRAKQHAKRYEQQRPGRKGKGHFLSRQVGSRVLLEGGLLDAAVNASVRESLHVHGVKAFAKFLEVCMDMTLRIDACVSGGGYVC